VKFINSDINLKFFLIIIIGILFLQCSGCEFGKVYNQSLNKNSNQSDITNYSQKISNNLMKNLKSSDMNNNDKLNITVICVNKINLIECKETIEKYSNILNSPDKNSFIIEIQKQKIYELAKEKIISILREQVVSEKNDSATNEVLENFFNETNCTDYYKRTDSYIQKIIEDKRILENETIKIQVSCFDSKNCINMLNKYGQIYNSFSDNIHNMLISKNNLLYLSCNKQVEYINYPMEIEPHIVKRPNASNILKYISEKELEALSSKIPEHIKNQGLYDYAINENGTIDLIILFYGNVTYEDAKKIVSKYGEIIDDYFDFHDLTVRVPQEYFWKIVNESKVRYVSEESPPPMLLK
jgi:hypothetical protein